MEEKKFLYSIYNFIWTLDLVDSIAQNLNKNKNNKIKMIAIGYCQKHLEGK